MRHTYTKNLNITYPIIMIREKKILLPVKTIRIIMKTVSSQKTVNNTENVKCS